MNIIKSSYILNQYNTYMNKCLKLSDLIDIKKLKDNILPLLIDDYMRCNNISRMELICLSCIKDIHKNKDVLSQNTLDWLDASCDDVTYKNDSDYFTLVNYFAKLSSCINKLLDQIYGELYVNILNEFYHPLVYVHFIMKTHSNYDKNLLKLISGYL